MATAPVCLPEQQAVSAGHGPRRPQDTVLYGVLQEHLQTFLGDLASADRYLPGFVVRELRAFLECGIHAHGFVRVRCGQCRTDRAVPFSCKRRGFCPSCGGRRMADVGAHWIDHVLPDVPMRQWVLTLPHRLRYQLAYDAQLVTEVLGVYLRTLFSWQRRRARRSGIDAPAELIRCGAVTAIQRFGSALNLNVHFHSIVPDGVFVADTPADQPRFVALPEPTNGELAHLAASVWQRVRRRLYRLGRLSDEDDGPDLLWLDEPTLAECYGASVQGRIATGHRAGQRVERFTPLLPTVPAVDIEGHLCARVEGFNLHARVTSPARQRDRLERLSRYLLRPAVAHRRLTRAAHGKLAYELKRPWSDGTTHVVLEPGELIEKLAALVPTPHKNLVRYHGVFAPNASWRSRIVPHTTPAPAVRPSAAEEGKTTQPRSTTRRHPPRRTWAELMARVFAIDVLACPDCGARTRIISVITSPSTIRRFLRCLGVPEHAPDLRPARPPPCEQDAVWTRHA